MKNRMRNSITLGDVFLFIIVSPYILIFLIVGWVDILIEKVSNIVIFKSKELEGN